MPSRYPAEVRKQVVDLARSGKRVAQLAETFGMSEATIYNWLKQERIDRGEALTLIFRDVSNQRRTGRTPIRLRRPDNRFGLQL